VSATLTGGGGAAKLGDRVGAGRLRASGSHGSTQDGPAEVLPRSGRAKTLRRRGIAPADRFHLRRRRAQFQPRLELGSRISGLRSFLVGRRSCRGPWPGLGRSSAASPRRGRIAAERWCGGAGSGVHRRWSWSGEECRRVAGLIKKERASDPGRACPVRRSQHDPGVRGKRIVQPLDAIPSLGCGASRRRGSSGD
jgi:hypothetical protein